MANNANLNTEEILFFELQKGSIRFTIGLSDILACLEFAEQKGETPEIPSSWWAKIQSLDLHAERMAGGRKNITKLPDRAILEEEVEELISPDAEDTIWFHSKKEDGQIRIGLSDILACLKFAEEQGEVPPLPWMWWLQMTGIYPKLNFFLTDALCGR